MAKSNNSKTLRKAQKRQNDKENASLSCALETPEKAKPRYSFHSLQCLMFSFSSDHLLTPFKRRKTKNNRKIAQNQKIEKQLSEKNVQRYTCLSLLIVYKNEKPNSQPKKVAILETHNFCKVMKHFLIRKRRGCPWQLILLNVTTLLGLTPRTPLAHAQTTPNLAQPSPT